MFFPLSSKTAACVHEKIYDSKQSRFCQQGPLQSTQMKVPRRGFKGTFDPAVVPLSVLSIQYTECLLLDLKGEVSFFAHETF